jgi:hypothetical protein
MPLTLNVGLSKKIGLPDYGSLGATCSVAVELPGSLIFDDLETFHKRVRDAYVACAQAVNDELARHQGADPPARQNGNGSSPKAADPEPQNGNGRTATTKQLDYARQLAGQIRGLGIRRMETLCERMFNKALVRLTSLDASGLIDTLKAIKAGDVDLDKVLNGAAS